MIDPAEAAIKERNRTLLISGSVVGFAYGFGLRLLSFFFPHFLSREGTWVMTVGFTVFLPFAMGFIAVFSAEMKQRQRVWIWLFLPWIPLAATLAATMLAYLEGTICVVMFAPLGMVVSTVGGVIGGLAARSLASRRSRNASLACVMLLPFLVTSWEKPVLYRQNVRRVENVIDIHASAATVWRNIERVPAIRREELPSSWSHRVGFPDPLEATLSHEGIGGVREASFTGGVLFIETLDVWEPERRLAFSIRAQIERIPPTTLDEHVRVGGPYFDVLRGEYRLEALGNGVVRLHLSSEHRISTDFNWYAHLWTDVVMADLQKRILFVIQQRCEGASQK